MDCKQAQQLKPAGQQASHGNEESLRNGVTWAHAMLRQDKIEGSNLAYAHYTYGMYM